MNNTTRVLTFFRDNGLIKFGQTLEYNFEIQDRDDDHITKTRMFGAPARLNKELEGGELRYV